MNRGEIKSRFRTYTSKAKTNQITDTLVETLIQEAVNDISRILELFPTSTTFNVQSEVQQYDLNSEITDLVKVREAGLKWYDGTNWNRLKAYTIEKLDEEYPYWEDDSSGDPLRYVIDGTNLIIHNKPDTALTDGFKLYYYKRPTQMDDDGDYPFSGTSTEIIMYEGLHVAILHYVRAYINLALDKKVTYKESMDDYINELAKQAKVLKKRPDITKDTKVRYTNVPSTRY